MSRHAIAADDWLEGIAFKASLERLGRRLMIPGRVRLSGAVSSNVFREQRVVYPTREHVWKTRFVITKRSAASRNYSTKRQNITYITFTPLRTGYQDIRRARRFIVSAERTAAAGFREASLRFKLSRVPDQWTKTKRKKRRVSSKENSRVEKFAIISVIASHSINGELGYPGQRVKINSTK
ncbi:hypothetical protein PUN28_000691 [Cardiocondyla obscurior]|uniref:Uncharacterized protein n=1 Tax=Cardiocondyla obscurior TaxID=286306 RepID=A0AAW2H0K0_9HYME